MSENDHLTLQEHNPEPKTRSDLKRLILEYLQTRNRKHVLEDLPSEEVSSWVDDS